MKLTKGTVIRIKSFAHVEPDGTMFGFSASPEDTPEAEKDIFICIMVGREPMVIKTEMMMKLYQMNVETELNILGWWASKNLEHYMKDNMGDPGRMFRKLVKEMHKDGTLQKIIEEEP